MMTVIYWMCTLLVAFENAAGAMWTFLPLIPGVNHSHPSVVFAEYLTVMLTHLGYPQYFRYILGGWQLGAAATLVTPRFPRLREWAYAGVFFNYSSAVLSHVLSGDPPRIWIFAAVLAVVTVTSWATRPRETRPLPWMASAGILVALFALSLLWLPQPPRFSP